jgi:hypothetical protein
MSEILMTGAVNGANIVDVLLGPITWTFDGHLRVGSYHDDLAGLESTLSNPHTYVIVNEVFGRTMVTFDPFSLPVSERCGTYQVDVERYAGDTASGNATFDFGTRCGTPSGDPHMPTPTPEPSTWLLVLCGLVVLARSVRTRRHA